MRITPVMFHPFCEYCGKERVVSLIPMQRGYAWFCFRCQIRYMLRTWRKRSELHALQVAYAASSSIEETLAHENS